MTYLWNHNPEALLLWPIALVVAVIIGKLFLDVTTSAIGVDDDYSRFMRDATARGLSYQEAMDEWIVREAMARLRRESTAAVLADPANWKQALDQATRDAFDRLASENPDLLPALGGMIKGLDYGHILYPEAARMVDRLVQPPALASMSIDGRAALRIVRPG